MTLAPDVWATRIASPRPLAADNPRRGLYRYPREVAVRKRHLQFNSPRVSHALVLDVDDDHAEHLVKSLALDTETIPVPSWTTINPHSGHAHVGYLYAAPVPLTDAARRKPITYAADIQRTLVERLGADRAYTDVVTRNPLHPGHGVWWGPSEPYTLGELHKGLGELSRPPKAPERVAREAGLGRNVSLFDTVRGRAYREFKHHETFETFERAVVSMATATNAVSFDTPLSLTEARCVGRSIARWTWKTFDAASFAKTQSERALMRKDAVRRQATIRQIRAMADEGDVMEVERVMDTFNVSRATAFRYMKEAGLAPDRTVGDRPAQVAELRAQGLSWAQVAERAGMTVSQARYAFQKAGK